MKKSLILGLLVLAVTCLSIPAAHFTINCGKYSVLIGNGGLPLRMSYDGVAISQSVSYTIQLPTEDGSPGIRFVIPNSKLDKTTSIDVTRDGEAVSELSGKIEGHEVKVVRTSQCENLKTTFSTLVTDKNITISTQYETTGEQGLVGLYAITIHWDHASVDWLAKMQNESFASGKFESNNGFFLHRTNQRTLWYALLFPESKIGAVTVLGDDTAMAGGCRFWDRALPNNHQMIYQVNLPKTLSADFKTAVYKMTISAFPATAETLQAEATKIAEPEEE